MGGGQLENTNLLKIKGICLLNTFLKDFTKMPIKETLFCSLMGGGISPPCQNHEGDKSPPPPPPLYETLNGNLQNTERSVECVLDQMGLCGGGGGGVWLIV